jgi:predicted aldo/keto reductase-like oxidoreductase
MRSRPLKVALACMLVAGLVGFVISGSLMVKSFIGLDPSAFPAGQLVQDIGHALLPSINLAVGGLVLALGSLLLVIIASFVLVRRSARAELPALDEEGRRSFLTGSLAGVAGAVGATAVGGGAMWSRAFAGVGNEGRGWGEPLQRLFVDPVAKTHPEYKQEWRGSTVESYGRLGRTDWAVSDTVLGTGRLQGEVGEKIVRLAIERGINYLDTAPDYSGSGSEQIIGRSLGGLRDKVFIATKFCTPVGHLPPGTPVARYKEVLEASLSRLHTDHVDLVHVHSCDELDRLMDENMHEAFDRLKEEGKVRFLGFSSHTPNLVQVANQAIDSGRFDVMMLAYHHGIWPEISNVIRRAREEQDMGVVAMKTLKGAKHRGLEDFGDHADSYAQAALKWVHADPNVSCAVISFFELQHVDEYLYASGKKLSGGDLAVLEEYDRRIRGSYCSPHCGECLSSCPAGLPIADILRHRMYFEDYGSEKEGMELYAGLEKNASACVGCSAPCMGSCPFGIPIKERMVGAHELLRFDSRTA